MTQNSRAWTITALTVLPDMFPGPLSASLAGRALTDGVWALNVVDIRNFASDKNRTVDDTPAGGGPGMVMRADIAAAAIDASRAAYPDSPIIYMSPRGAPLTQSRVRALTEEQGAIILCARFEGLDERVIEARGLEQISVGDYVLSGGELAAMVLIDACVRLLPGVMGAEGSGVDESFENGLLEYPHYTKPRTWEGHDIPEVLLSGDHGKIAQWRRLKSEEITRRVRPDLLRKQTTP